MSTPVSDPSDPGFTWDGIWKFEDFNGKGIYIQLQGQLEALAGNDHD